MAIVIVATTTAVMLNWLAVGLSLMVGLILFYVLFKAGTMYVEWLEGGELPKPQKRPGDGPSRL